MHKLVQKGKHSSALRICGINKNERRVCINQRECTEFRNIERSVRICPDNAVHHHQHAHSADCFSEQSKRLCTGLYRFIPIAWQRQGLPNHRSQFRYALFPAQRSDVAVLFVLSRNHIVSHPLLNALHLPKRVNQLTAWVLQLPAVYRTELKQFKLLLRLPFQKEIADRNMYFAAELLKLRERGLLFSAPPLFKLLSHGSGDLHGCVDPVPDVTRNFHGIRHSSTSLRFCCIYSLIFFTFAQSLYRKEAQRAPLPPERRLFLLSFLFSYPSLLITSSLFIPFNSIRFSAPGVSKGSASFPSLA